MSKHSRHKPTHTIGRDFDLGNVEAVMIGTDWYPVRMALGTDHVVIAVSPDWIAPGTLRDRAKTIPGRYVDKATRQDRKLVSLPVNGLPLKRASRFSSALSAA